MERSVIQNKLFPTCPIRNVLARLGDKWSLLVILTLNNADKPLRFNTLQKSLPDISQKMLTITLRTLEEDGFVHRKIYAEIPPKVEYTLTERALSLLPHINNLVEWAEINMQEILKDRKKSVHIKNKI